MKIRTVLPVLLAAIIVTPASANWFSNPKLGINRCVCSAPSPTPEQVRAARQPPFVLREEPNPVTVADAAAKTQPAPQAPPPR